MTQARPWDQRAWRTSRILLALVFGALLFVPLLGARTSDRSSGDGSTFETGSSASSSSRQSSDLDSDNVLNYIALGGGRDSDRREFPGDVSRSGSSTTSTSRSSDLERDDVFGALALDRGWSFRSGFGSDSWDRSDRETRAPEECMLHVPDVGWVESTPETGCIAPGADGGWYAWSMEEGWVRLDTGSSGMQGNMTGGNGTGMENNTTGTMQTV